MFTALVAALMVTHTTDERIPRGLGAPAECQALGELWGHYAATQGSALRGWQDPGRGR